MCAVHLEVVKFLCSRLFTIASDVGVYCVKVKGGQIFGLPLQRHSGIRWLVVVIHASFATQHALASVPSVGDNLWTLDFGVGISR
jgi:hypothetical protein